MSQEIKPNQFSKIDEDFNFRFHKNYDVSAIQEKVNSWGGEWLIDKSRQELYPSHKETNTYFLMEHSNQWLYGDAYEPEVRYEDPEIWALVEPIIKEYEEKVQGKVGKAVFIKLPAGKDVGGHRDFGEYLDVVRRFHVPIFTNSGVEFIIRNEVKNMKEGECWEINNNRMHAVRNTGITDRVHLLFDIMPNWAIEAAGTVDRTEHRKAMQKMHDDHI